MFKFFYFFLGRSITSFCSAWDTWWQ